MILRNLLKLYLLAVAFAFLSIPQVSYADLILTLNGVQGSSLISYVATGNVMVDSNYLADNGTSTGHAPVAGAWDSGFDNNLGDIFSVAGFSNSTSTGNSNLLLSSPVSYRRNGVEFASLNRIDLVHSTNAGDDDVELESSTNQNYPSLSNGDVISWTGSGTFTLRDSQTADTAFLAASGSFSAPLDNGMNYVVNYAVAAVPEPSSFLFLSLVGIAFGGGFRFWNNRRIVLS